MILVVGMDLLRLYVYFEPARAIPEHIKIVHIDEDAWQIGKNYPVEVGLLGDLKVGLAELSDLLCATMSTSQVDGAEKRAAALAETHAQARAAILAEAKAQRDAGR